MPDVIVAFWLPCLVCELTTTALMRILLLTQIIPYPPDAGPRVKTWHVLRHLHASGHEITLVSFVRPDETRHVKALEKLCERVHTVPIRRSRFADAGYWIRSHFTGRPFLIERDDRPAMRNKVRCLLASERFDVIHADQLTMTQFALDKAGSRQEKLPFTIFDAHNATWTISYRMLDNAPRLLKPALLVESRRIRRYEGRLVKDFAHTTVVIEADRDALLQGVSDDAVTEAAERISVIPIGVDTDALKPVQRRTNSMRILALGSLNYPPNADGIRWFMREVFPLVLQQEPKATLTVVGKAPPADFARLAAKYPDKIRITGYVTELTPIMEECAIMVVPLRAASGMRVRILEAFARGMPVVTTAIGLEGINAQHEKQILVADDRHDFSRMTVRLLHDVELQERLAQNGRMLAEKRYDWRVALKKIDAVYARAREMV